MYVLYGLTEIRELLRHFDSKRGEMRWAKHGVDIRRTSVDWKDSTEELQEEILRNETHYFLERKGFKWVPEGGCFQGVDNRIYGEARDIVQFSIDKYFSILDEGKDPLDMF